ncbi:MAG TPA: outer membrane beta-barrel protein [Bryobacteraceae bacterium]|nr:outer membrane beta-barrel protein [Bryobacteraceae bacterium]
MALLTPAFAQPLPTSERDELLERIKKLEERLAVIEGRQPVVSAPPSAVPAPAAPATPTGAATGVTTATPTAPATAAAQPGDIIPPQVNALFGGTTINVNFDGYYGYNFNRPIGRINLLRAYDVLSNNFTLNQAGVIIERAPNPEAGRRLGVRLDLMYGEATETLQGGAQNEPRPQVYRNVFQAYGTYVFPIGKGLNVDFGKFASSLGYEGNYVKDQINYSRAYWFNFLPFYHMGFRTSYAINDRLSVTNYLVNGANQTEDFNGFKSTAFLINIKPTSKISWNLNYFIGQEQRDLVPDLNPGLPTLPTQPGLSTTPIRPTPNGRFQVMDTYASWNATDKLLLVGELDTVLNRTFKNSPPSRATGGAAYVKYQFTPKFHLGGRFEVMQDSGGIFSLVSQTLKEATVTAVYEIANGLQTRWEYRRDFSNVPFFLTDTLGVLKKEQNTATLGLIWWFGGKEGSW